MGLDKYKKTPCGFCFVEYYLRADAENCMRYINGTRLDDRIIRTDWDAGFIEGRQYGRGKTGGQVIFEFISCVYFTHKMCDITMLYLFFQVRDEYRSDFDSGRGGYGKIIQQKVTSISDGAFGR